MVSLALGQRYVVARTSKQRAMARAALVEALISTNEFRPAVTLLRVRKSLFRGILRENLRRPRFVYIQGKQ